MQNSWWRHTPCTPNQNKARSEILSELHLVVSDCTIPWHWVCVHWEWTHVGVFHFDHRCSQKLTKTSFYPSLVFCTSLNLLQYVYCHLDFLIQYLLTIAYNSTDAGLGNGNSSIECNITFVNWWFKAKSLMNFAGGRDKEFTLSSNMGKIHHHIPTFLTFLLCEFCFKSTWYLTMQQ